MRWNNPVAARMEALIRRFHAGCGPAAILKRQLQPSDSIPHRQQFGQTTPGCWRH
jgi:hypothetical protein